MTEGLPRIERPAPMERYRIQPDVAVYFVTYSVIEWLPVFISESA